MNTQNNIYKKYKVSKFNILIPEKQNSFLLVNTLSTAVIRVSAKNSIFKNIFSEGGNFFNLHIDNTYIELLNKNGFIVEDDFDELKWLENLHWKARNGSEALGIGVITTLNCNFRCKYCYQQRDSLKLNNNVEEKIFKYAKNNINGKRILKIAWFGGEPLLNIKSIISLSKKFRKLTSENNIQYEASITTNGYLLTPKYCKILLEEEISCFQITLDGPPLIHDERRFLINHKPTFNRIFQNLINMKNKFRRIILRINIDENNKDKIENLLEILKPLKDNVELAIRPTIYPDLYESNVNRCIPPKNYVKIHYNINKLALDRGFTTIQGYSFPGTSFCSGYQFNSFSIDPLGDVHKCPVYLGNSKYRYGYLDDKGNLIVENGLQNQWDSWSPFNDKDCKECKVLPLCMGGCLDTDRNNKNKTYRCLNKHNILQGILNEKSLNFY